ncbi:MAG TPA: PqqD family protein [Acidimicrobiales bacterium]|nr:PqqD family protein [Acidimicrobiales bacterium]
MSSEPGPVLRLKPRVEWQHVDDEVVVLDLSSSAYLALNGTGAALWPLVAAGTTERGLVEELTARFPVDVDQAQADVTRFTTQLRDLALLEVETA